MKMTNERGKRIRDVSEPNFLYQTRNYFRSRAANSGTIEFDESEFPKPQFSEIGIQTDKVDEGYGSDPEQNKAPSGVNKMIEEKLRKQKLKEKSKPPQQPKLSPKTTKKVQEKPNCLNPPRKVIAPSITPGSSQNAKNISTQPKPTDRPEIKLESEIITAAKQEPMKRETVKPEPVKPEPVKPELEPSKTESKQEPERLEISSKPVEISLSEEKIKLKPNETKSEEKTNLKIESDSKAEPEVKITIKPVIKPVNLGSLVSNTVNTGNDENSIVKEPSKENDPVADFKAIQAEDEKWMRQLQQKKQVQATVIDVSKLSFENSKTEDP